MERRFEGTVEERWLCVERRVGRALSSSLSCSFASPSSLASGRRGDEEEPGVGGAASCTFVEVTGDGTVVGGMDTAPFAFSCVSSRAESVRTTHTSSDRVEATDGVAANAGEDEAPARVSE